MRKNTEKGRNAQMLLMSRNSFRHTLTYSHILLSIPILSILMVNVESALSLPGRLNGD